MKWGRHDVIRKKESETDEALIQLWFAGNHSDIGGSYPESESRLSDIALEWMVEQATSHDIPNRLLVDRRVLHLFPDPTALQHCEILGFANAHPVISRFVNWTAKPRKGVLGGTLHPSVEVRFACNEVCQSGVTGPYRPETLREDVRFGSYYSDSISSDG